METKKANWLQELQPGDEVVIRGTQGYGRRDKIRKVSRLTKSQIIVEMMMRENRFSRETGREIGARGQSHFLSLEPLTPEMRLLIQTFDLVDQVLYAAKHIQTATLKSRTPEELQQFLAQIRRITGQVQEQEP